MDPNDETAWSKIIGRPSSVRSIFLPTELVGLNLIYRGQIVKVVLDRVPFQEFVLPSFTFPTSLEGGFSFNLWLTDARAIGATQLSSVFTIRWSSFYRRADGSYKFVYRPNAIFVLLPREGSYPPVDFPHPKPPKAGIKAEIALDPKPLKTLYMLRDNFLSKHVQSRALGVPKSSSKSGFNGYPRLPPGDWSTSVPAYIRTFRSAGPPFGSSEPDMVVALRSTLSTRTPNFRRLRKALLPVNAYLLDSVVNCDGGMASFIDGPTGWIHSYQTRSQGTRFPNLTRPGFDANLYNKTLFKIQKRAGVAIEGNIAQDLAQIGQLKTLIASTTRKIVSSVKHVKSGQLYQAAIDLVDYAGPAKNLQKNMTTKQSVASNWLALQYGWKPLMQDIDGLLATIAQALVGRPLVYTSRARSHKEVKDVVLADGFGHGTPKIKQEIRYDYHCRIGIRYSVASELVSFCQQLGFTNPINLAWEVLPYSFVADWFLPIGPVLSSLSAWDGLSFKDGFVTQSVRREFSSAFDVSWGDANGINREQASLQQSWFRLERGVLTDFPRPNVPRPKDPTSLIHALNGLALIQSAFGREPPPRGFGK